MTYYTAEELADFELLLRQKLELAREALGVSRGSLINSAEQGSKPCKRQVACGEDGRDGLMMLIIHQQQFISQLEAARVRIRQGIYGICRVTGKLIPKGRLREVPQATTCLEAGEDKG